LRVIDQGTRAGKFDSALVLHPWGICQLAELGFMEELLPRGKRIEAIEIFEHGIRKEQAVEQWDKNTPFLLSLPKSCLENFLAEKLEKRGITVGWQFRLASARPSGERLEAEIHRLEKDETGLGSSWMGHVVRKTETLSVRYVLGADGMDSTVRLAAGIPFVETGAPEAFAEIEFEAEREEGGKAKFLVEEGRRAALWPLPDRRFRAILRISEERLRQLHARGGETSRASEDLGNLYVDLSESAANELLEEIRAILPPGVCSVHEATAMSYQPGHAEAFAKGHFFLCGQAAHVASPAAWFSLNAGFREAGRFASYLQRVRRGSHPRELEECAAKELRFWEASALKEGERWLPGAQLGFAFGSTELPIKESRASA
jgi:2-polyprenyl-6-methoxyphenol hydroxylase-like FAD-dependent oxidoreductase